jgi:HD-like signal output (HDOD) protein
MMDLTQVKASQDVAAWVKFLKTADIPVLKQTAREINRLKEDEENVSARDIAMVVLSDPMMVFKVLTYAQTHKSRNQLQDLAQVEQALLMMGTATFFNHIPPQPVVEDLLSSHMARLMDLLKLIVRAHRASRYAAEFAAHLMDLHAEEVRVAALLHDLTEMLMWCFASEKMSEIAKLQAADVTLRSKVAQEQVFGFKLIDLQKHLIEAFQLPPLLAQLMEDASSESQRVKNVRIAVNLARHSANGWDNAALPDDYRDVAALLRVDVDRALHIIGVPKATS